MNTNNPNPDDGKLRSLLRQSRVAPPLPPRFREDVWRRIADAEADQSADSPGWLGDLIAWVLRPRLAVASLIALVFAGALFGVHQLVGERIFD